MANRYAGTPLSSEWDSVQRRRAVNKALLEQAMNTPGGTEFVRGGRVGPTQAVPYSWGTGAAQLGKALIARMGEKKAKEQEQAIAEKYSAGQAEGVQKVMEALQGRGNTSQYGPQVPVEPDRDKAAMILANDPYLQNNDVAKALINSGAYGKSGSNRAYSKVIYDEDGNAISYNARTGEATPIEVGGKGVQDPRYTPGSQYNLNRAKQLGTGQAENLTDPVTARNVRQAESDVDLAMKPEIKKQTDLAERSAEKIITKPKIESAISAAETKTSMLDDLIDKAEDQASRWTTGFVGGMVKTVPGTPAYDLTQTLSTIKANIGFDKLQEMRNNSPTGGALGQVSEFENKLLQDVWGALEQSQTEGQFKENLQRVKKQTKESWSRINKAYEADYGKPYSEAKKENKAQPEGVPPELWDIMTPEERAAWQ